MFDYFKTWPLDGLLSFIGICFSLVLIFIGAWPDTKKVKVNDDGSFVLKLRNSMYILIIGIFLSSAIVVYAIFQSYRGQEISAFTVGAIFVIVSIYYLFITIQNKRFYIDNNSLTVKSNFGKQHTYMLSDIVGISFNINIELITNEGKKISISRYYDGLLQLVNFFSLYFQKQEKERLEGLEVSNEDYDFFNHIKGKEILFIFPNIDKHYLLENTEYYTGRILSIEKDHLNIQIDKIGDNIKLPINLVSYKFISDKFVEEFEEVVKDLIKNNKEGKPEIAYRWIVFCNEGLPFIS